jgi:flagellar biosynthesis/type III secretory pathway protein FliH
MLNKIKKKYQEKLNEAYATGWSTGYDVANTATLKEAKKVFIKLLQKEVANGNIDYIDGIERSIKLIKEYK